MDKKHIRRLKNNDRAGLSLRIILSLMAVFLAGHLGTESTAEGSDVDYVIHVVFDGLRPEVIPAIGPEELPNVYRMIAEGSWTDNGRADFDNTETLPNHADMLTSRPVKGRFGHGVSFNTDDNGTIHNAAGSYVTSVFDLVHDHGLRTGLFASKDKFAFFDRSWNAAHGRLDSIGPDNGRDKIDVYEHNDSTAQLTDAFIAAMTENPFNYVMISLRDPDSVGHGIGWMSSDYREAVQAVDGYLGQILTMVDTSPVLNGKTIVFLMTDHGGTGYGHNKVKESKNYRIPFGVWGAGVKQGGDLYIMNSESRKHPGDGRPNHKKNPQPIRNGDSANLATQLLGLETVEDSLFNSNHDMVVGDDPAKNR